MTRPEKIIWGGPQLPSPLKRLRRRYDREWERYKLDREKTRHRRSQAELSERRVAFIFGCQRSGTTMALRVLNHSWDVDGIDENNPQAFKITRILDKDTRDSIVKRSTAGCIVFKPICDSHRALELISEHRDCRAFWVYRGYRDVANSAIAYWHDQTQLFIEDLLGGGGNWGIAQWNRENLSEECLEEVREASSGGLTPHGACALFWYMRNRLFFEQDLQENPAVAITKYEASVRRPEEEFSRLCSFLGVGFRAKMVENVFADSVEKEEFPKISQPIEELCE